MLILAVDTTTRAGSVAVGRDGEILAVTTGDPAVTHGERLPRQLEDTLGRAGCRVSDLDLLAVVAGPGSFTGLRVGIAAMQGLALARGLRIVPVSALDALAEDAGRDAAGEVLLAPWIDAQRGEVFAALYDRERHPLTEPSSALPAATLAAWQPVLTGGRVLFAGDGAVRYAELVRDTLGAQAVLRPGVPMLAATAARLAAAHPERAVAPHAVMPLYVRRPDAELARDRRVSADAR